MSIDFSQENPGFRAEKSAKWRGRNGVGYFIDQVRIHPSSYGVINSDVKQQCVQSYVRS